MNCVEENESSTPFAVVEPNTRKTPRPLSSLKSISLRVAVPHRTTLSPKSIYQPETPGSAFMLDYVKSPLSYAFASHRGDSPLFKLDEMSTTKKYGSRVGGSMSERRTSMVDMMNKMAIQAGNEVEPSLIVTSSTLSRANPTPNRPLSIRVTQKTNYTSYSSPSLDPTNLGSPTSTVSAGPIPLPKLLPRPTSLSTRNQARRPHILDLALPSSPRSRRSSGQSVRTPLSAKFGSSVSRASTGIEKGLRSAPLRDMTKDVGAGA
jgi:hypothetical protein